MSAVVTTAGATTTALVGTAMAPVGMAMVLATSGPGFRGQLVTRMVITRTL